MKTTLTVRLPAGLRQELRKLSRAERLSVSDIIRDSLKQYLATRRFRNLRRKVLPFAEAQGLLTDEDIFKQMS
ncbi:MAG TPA: ribbon-helix-helix protein, CopG family [Bdellovibrionota bacterium]|nr:ribbon-helix-helix protein, CopG family [Bdellovibrionota bacterium]